MAKHETEATGWTPERLAQMRETFGRSYQFVNTVTMQGVIKRIVCLYCGRASTHKKDIAEKYCGACKRFHDEARA